jgi:hypothetical protein
MPEAAPVIATTLPERVFMRAWYAIGAGTRRC